MKNPKKLGENNKNQENSKKKSEKAMKIQKDIQDNDFYGGITLLLGLLLTFIGFVMLVAGGLGLGLLLFFVGIFLLYLSYLTVKKGSRLKKELEQL